MKKAFMLASLIVMTALSAGFAAAGNKVVASEVQGTLPQAVVNNSMSQGPFTPYQRTLAQINALAASAVGQVVMCTDCTTATMCTSSSTAAGGWVVTVATGAFVGATWSGLPHCK
jgi:hypothetical protein